MALRIALRTCGLLLVVLNIGTMGSSMHDKALQLHNEYRSKHGCPPLALNDEANKYAQDYAEHLIEIDKMTHSKSHGKYGENLFSFWSSAAPPDNATLAKQAVEAWYNEIKLYNYEKPGFSGGTGHFTQVVWKNSKFLGFGLALKKKTNGHKVYIVAEYSPPGNYMGGFEKNVPKPISGAITSVELPLTKKITSLIVAFVLHWSNS